MGSGAGCAVYKLDDHALVSGWSAEGNSASVRSTQFPQRLCQLLRAALPGLGIRFWSRFEVANPVMQDLPDQPGQSMGDYPKAPGYPSLGKNRRNTF
jgi:hypothetical protein